MKMRKSINKNQKNKGITLIALIITIIVLIILASITINYVLGESGLMDHSKNAKFSHYISTLEEQAELIHADTLFEKVEDKDIIPNKGELTEEEKSKIIKEIPTLAESVYKATGESVYDRELYWYDVEKVGHTAGKKYLIDMSTRQVYDYEGEYFYKKMWHTLKIGIDDDGSGDSDGIVIPDGYMRIHLYYPEESTDRQWRIGRAGEVRTDGELVWQDYTGNAILVKIDDIKNIWIRYNLKGVEVIEAPSGTLVVDIRANPTTQNVDKVTVEVYYDKDSTNRKIKIGNSGWMIYDGPYEVTENCTIQAMAEKKVDVTDGNGNVIGNTTVKGKDSLAITNIGEVEKDETLEAPTIVETSTTGTEKARVRIDYPTDKGTIKKVYKINSGIEQEYTGEIAIEEWGTEIIAYYYKEDKQSQKASKKFEDPTKLEVKILVQPNPAMSETIKKAIVEIEYSDQAESKTYKINNGQEQNYTGPLTVREDCTITAYARKIGIDTAMETETIQFKKVTEEIDEIDAPSISQVDSSDKTNATITIAYDAKAVTKQYSINGGELQDYTGSFKAVDGDVIYAINTDSDGNTKDATHTVKIEQDKENEEEEEIDELDAPRITQVDSSDKTNATITIAYDSKAVTKQYSINGGELQDYTGSFKAVDGDVIYAVNTDSEGSTKDATHTVKISISEGTEETDEIDSPTINQVDSSDKTNATITITYDSKAVTKQYSINGGELQDYTSSFKAVNGDVIYAINTDSQGNTKDATHTVKIEQDEEEETEEETYELQAPVVSPSYLEENSKAKINITYDSKAVTKQYSINGGELQNYTGSFEVTENGTVIYAINTDSEGNIKDTTYTVTGIIKKLSVNITVDPDTEEEVDKVTVTIDYDANATQKIYSIDGGTTQNYTGPFEVTENCTIIAEAKAESAYGKESKQITNLANGLAAPLITETKTIETSGEVANITIEYDERSISNTYTINSGSLQDYSEGFQIRENDTVITAYSVDSKGDTEVSQYVVNDLIRYLLIDKGKYYWIQLPYPESSINRQYKYQETGTWKEYNEDGFILVKPEYESELIEGGKPIKLEVEEGRYVDFDGHWYILDGDVNQLQEDIYMKWDEPADTTTTRIPLQILVMPAPPEQVDEVDVFIIYPPTAIAKQYKINDGEYQEYTGQLNITENNTTITAKTQYSDGSWSEEVSYTITHINEDVAPEGIIDITAEPTEWTNGNVNITIVYNPNSETLKKKYKIGEGNWQYITEDTVTFEVEENTAIYAALENNQGESSDAEVYNVENIDKTDPTATIEMPSYETTNTDFEAIVTLNDSESGIELTKCKWILNTSSEKVGTTESDYTGGTFTETNQTLTFNEETAGIYYLHVLVTDKVGNKIEKIGTVTLEVPTGPNGKQLVSSVTTTNHETITGEDANGNQVVIPGGFKIANDSGITVQQGIVIEDAEENQFVWIPVSNINNDGSNPIILDDGSTVEITLGRYTFDKTTGKALTTTGKYQYASRYTSTVKLETYYTEKSTFIESNGKTNTSATNTTAKDLAGFINSIEINKGYYLARYEASYASGSEFGVGESTTYYKSASKASTVTRTDSSTTLSIGMLWNYISQANASKVSRQMYYEDSYVESDLCNSYAWDTAILYIQAMGNSNYANQKDESGTIKNTGETGDEKCKIFDMAGNLGEDTTEYSTYKDSSYRYPNTRRGGVITTTYYTSSRLRGVNGTSMYDTFRPVLYIK